MGAIVHWLLKHGRNTLRFSIRIVIGLAVAAMLMSMTQPIYAQDDPQITAIQQKIKDQIVLTRLTSNGDIAVAGSVIVLQKDGLWMCGTNGGGPYENTYKNGNFSVGRFGWGMKLGLLQIDMNSIPQLKFVKGDKFWVTSYSVDKNGVHFGFLSDPINDIRYYTLLKFPFPKGSLPPVDDILRAIAEVVTVQPSDDATQSSAPPAAPPASATSPGPGHPGNGFSETPIPAANFAPVAPPPPPPPSADAPPTLPKTVSLGQTKDQVVAILGRPQKVADLGVKEIDYYSDMKVIFIHGKVTDIQ
jgi:hypothetical protein